MTSRQQPIGTGFTAASTADDVLAGRDLSGTEVVVTGGGAGLGLQTARALSRAGATVTVGVRDVDRATAALDGAERVEVDRLDLLDPASIQAFCARRLDSARPLHVLVNNAGMGTRNLTRDARGYEATFATGHLGAFALTGGLRPALLAARGARVVNLTSGAHRVCDIRWDDPHFRTGYDPDLAYAQTKTAAILFAVELDRRWAPDHVRGYAVHPGIAVATSLAHPGTALHTPDQMRAMDLIDDHGDPVIDPEREKKTPQQAAATVVFAATSPLLAGIGGVYLKNSDVAAVDDTPWTTTVGTEPILSSDVAPHALDPASARRLWELSERLLAE